MLIPWLSFRHTVWHAVQSNVPLTCKLVTSLLGLRCNTHKAVHMCLAEHACTLAVLHLPEYFRLVAYEA